MKKDKSNSKNSTQELIGVKKFSRNGVLTSRGELVFFVVNPTNISVLSQTSIAVKVRYLMQLLTAQPDLDVICMDDSECFDDNKEYLKKRLKEERNPQIRALLQKDLKFLDEIQISMATARKFMFVTRLRNESNEQSFANLNRIEKVISEQGFEVKRATKGEIKRFLAIYFGRTGGDEELPDFDGEAAYEQVRTVTDEEISAEFEKRQVKRPVHKEEEIEYTDETAHEPEEKPSRKWVIP